MKTKDLIKSEIDEILSSEHESEKQDKKNRTRLKLLNKCLWYLEKNPSVSFIEKQLQTTERKLEVFELDSSYDNWLKSARQDILACENKEAKYRSEMGIAELRSQIKTLNYLLS